MSWWHLIQDWWERKGPEYWDPEQDVDVRYLRRERDDAIATTERLRGAIRDSDASLTEALRRARRDAARPLRPDGGRR